MLILTVVVHKILIIKMCINFLNKMWFQNQINIPNVIKKEEQHDNNKKEYITLQKALSIYYDV